MCISKKGKGYEPVAAVTAAVEKCGWTPEKFFSCAEAFAGKKNGFNAMAAVEEFKTILVNRAAVIEHMVSSTAVVFADWVLIKDISAVQQRFHNY